MRQASIRIYFGDLELDVQQPSASRKIGLKGIRIGLLNAARPTRELKAEQIHISSIQRVLKDKVMTLGKKGDLYAGFDRSRNILKRTFIER